MIFAPSIIVVLAHMLLFVIALFMGALILVHNQKSATNQIFAMMALTIIGWDIGNFLSFSFVDIQYQMLAVRFLMTFAGMLVSLVFIFALVYPKEDRGSTLFKRILEDIFFGLFCLMGFFVFADPDFSVVTSTLTAKFVTGFFSLGGIDIPLLPVWGMTSIILSFSTAAILLVKFLKTTGEERKGQMIVLWSIATTFFLLPLLLFVPPALFKNNLFVPFAPLVYIPMFVGIAYAIVKQHVFNVRIVYAEALVFAMMFIMFVFIFV